MLEKSTNRIKISRDVVFLDTKENESLKTKGEREQQVEVKLQPIQEFDERDSIQEGDDVIAEENESTNTNEEDTDWIDCVEELPQNVPEHIPDVRRSTRPNKGVPPNRYT